MATIFEKFPGAKVDQNKVRPFPIAATFTGILDAGYYVFNERQKVYESSSNDLIVLDGLEMGASIDQLDFNKGLEIPFYLDVIRGGNGHPVTLAPFRFHSFNQGANFSTNWRPTATENNGEEIYLQLRGSIKQHADIATLPEVKIHLAAMLYLCKDGFQG